MTTDSSPQPALVVFFDAVRDSYLIIITVIVMFTGVGQMSARAGLDVMQTGAMTALTLTAPAQAAAMSILTASGSGAGGGAWITAVTAVVVINLRFIVMVASVMARLLRMSLPRLIATLGLLSASSFAVVFPRLIDSPPRRPALYVVFICLLCCSSAVLGAVMGHRMSGTVLPVLGAALGAAIPAFCNIGDGWFRDVLDRTGFGIMGGIVAQTALRSGQAMFVAGGDPVLQKLGMIWAVLAVAVAFLLSVWRK